VEKILEDANIKLSSIASNTFGASGKRIIEELMRGELKPEAMAELSKGRLRSRKAEMKEALVGNMEDHHRFMIQAHLTHIAMVEELLATVEQKIQEKIERHFKKEYDLLRTIPPVKDSASVIIAEIGVNMDPFPTEMHLSSWSGMSPGNNESAGKKKPPSDYPWEQTPQDHTDRIRMDRLEDERDLPLVEIPQSRGQKGEEEDPRRRRPQDTHHVLPHTQTQGALQRAWPPLPRRTQERPHCEELHKEAFEPRVRGNSERSSIGSPRARTMWKKVDDYWWRKPRS